MPNFKKPRGGFAKKFMSKSPMKAADAGLMAAVGTNEVKVEHMGKAIEAMGKSQRSSQLIDNIQAGAALALGVPPSALPDSGGQAEMFQNIAGKIKGGTPQA